MEKLQDFSRLYTHIKRLFDSVDGRSQTEADKKKIELFAEVSKRNGPVDLRWDLAESPGIYSGDEC